MPSSNNSSFVLSTDWNPGLWFGVNCDQACTAIGAGPYNGTMSWYNLTQSPPVTITGRWVILTMWYDQSFKKVYTWVNGVARPVFQGPYQQNGGRAWNNLYIGQNSTLSNGDYKLGGYIADILIYDSAVPRTNTEAYLAGKYGITLGV
jgi:hypothetical protein